MKPEMSKRKAFIAACWFLFILDFDRNIAIFALCEIIASACLVINQENHNQFSKQLTEYEANENRNNAQQVESHEAKLIGKRTQTERERSWRSW